MKLGDLKKALAKFPPDMHDMEVALVYAKDDKRRYDLLTFVGYIPLKGTEAIALGGLSELQRMVENGTMEKPDGYIPPSESE